MRVVARSPCMALFAGAAPLPLADECTIADCPMLHQLARLDDDSSHAILVLVDSRVARAWRGTSTSFTCHF